MSEENKAMVRRMVEVINAGDIEATVEELFAPRASGRSSVQYRVLRVGVPCTRVIWGRDLCPPRVLRSILKGSAPRNCLVSGVTWERVHS